MRNIISRRYFNNYFLAFTNIQILYPILAVKDANISPIYKTLLRIFLPMQFILSVAQHITEHRTSAHGLTGYSITSQPLRMEKCLLSADRSSAMCLAIIFASMIYAYSGLIFLIQSKLMILLAISLVLIGWCDYGFINHPISYAIVHSLWHICIYTFLGMCLQSF